MVAPAPTLPPPAVVAAASPTVPVTPTALPLPTATEEPVALPTETVQPTATALPTDIPLPTATATVPPPTATPEPIITDWLSYLNQFREMASLPALSERAALTLGSRLHSQYMVVNDAGISHKQDPSNPLYDEAGDQAARNGNVFSTSMTEADYEWGINFWVSAPFHLLPMLEPDLERVGYGDYNEAGGSVGMAAVLDVRSERDTITADVTYPLLFPGDGTETWIGRHNLFEWPDPLTSCPGYTRPTGPPIVVQLGPGDLTPAIGGHSVTLNGEPVHTCLFDESTYYNPDVYEEKAGRLILNNQDAVIIIPRQPLIAGETYRVQLEADGQRYDWTFTTRASANR